MTNKILEISSKSGLSYITLIFTVIISYFQFQLFEVKKEHLNNITILNNNFLEIKNSLDKISNKIETLENKSNIDLNSMNSKEVNVVLEPTSVAHGDNYSLENTISFLYDNPYIITYAVLAILAGIALYYNIGINSSSISEENKSLLDKNVSDITVIPQKAEINMFSGYDNSGNFINIALDKQIPLEINIKPQGASNYYSLNELLSRINDPSIYNDYFGPLAKEKLIHTESPEPGSPLEAYHDYSNIYAIMMDNINICLKYIGICT